MKLRFMICAIAAGTALFADDVTSSTYGVMSVVTNGTQAVVGVPWKNVGEGDVTLANLVSTTTLAAGDKVYFYNGGTWYSYELDSSKAWKAATTVSGSGGSAPAAADAQTFALGTGLLIERASTSDPIYLVGRYDGNSTTVAAGATVLISNPTTAEKSITSGNEGDEIRILKADGGMDSYTKRSDGWYGPGTKTVGKYTVKTTVKFADGVPFGVGKAALYINKGENAASISWQ